MSTAQHSLKEKARLDKKIAEQKVLENELSSLKKGAHVYKQQQNSDIFFMSSVPKEMASAKQNLNNLMREYQKMEIQMETTGDQ